MEAIINTVITTLSPTALPVVILCLGGLYLWFKFGRMEKDRQETKNQRDTDSQNIHDDILKLKFKVNELDGRTVHHADLLEDLREQVATLNSNISKLSVQIEMYCNLLKDKK